MCDVQFGHLVLLMVGTEAVLYIALVYLAWFM